MGKWIETITDLEAGAETLRSRRYGVIEVRGGRLACVRLRPWPKLASLFGVLVSQWHHRWIPGDQVRLYYNQPLRHSNFLAVKFAVSSRHTTWASIRRALETLEEIARIKGTDALLCEPANFRISDRMLTREGWVRHTSSRWRRHYIKRFYGAYPQRAVRYVDKRLSERSPEPVPFNRSA